MENKGFSLIELMIVVVIIGVLGMIAIPTYRDYVVRAKVSNLIAAAQPSKLAVTEALASGQHATPNVIENQGMAQSITVAANGTITIVGNSAQLGIPAGAAGADRVLTLTFTPNLDHQDFVIWQCLATPAELQHFAPAECRAQALAAANPPQQAPQ